MEPHLILGIGELLWDLLPEGPRLGGAPANFTVMAGRLGSHAAILSRIGRDDLGRKAVDLLDPLPADTEFLQVDPVHETGRVTVAFKDGQPEYTIHEPAAWDFLELSDEWVRLAERADAICFGSLAQRSLESRQTIQTLAAQAKAKCVRVFDVNLRAPFYSSEVVQESLELASVMKMNDAEVPLVLGLLGLQAFDPERPGRPAIGSGEAAGGVSHAADGGRHARRMRKPSGHARGLARPSRHSRESRRYHRRRRCVYGRHDHLHAARRRPRHPERGGEPLGRLGGFAVGSHAAA